MRDYNCKTRCAAFLVLPISLATAGLVLTSGGMPAGARDRYPGQYDHVESGVRSWVKGLKDKGGTSCCDTADGYPAEAVWDIQQNKYKVMIDGVWHTVPDEAVITEPNRLGYATVWYWYSWEADGTRRPNVRCFLPGSAG